MKNNINTIVLCAAAVLAACEQPASTPDLISGLRSENMDKTVKPGDNFHMHVNGKWINETEIPADKASYGMGYIVHEQSQDNVKAIIEESASGDFELGSDEQKVGDLYASYMNMDKRNELGVAPLQAEFDKIDGLESLDQLVEQFAYMGRYGIDAPIGLSVYVDLKNPDQYVLYNGQGGLGLPDREYYLSESQEFPSIRVAYIEHIVKMFELAGLDNAEKNANTVMALETKIAEKHWKKEDTRDMMKLYNVFSVDSLDALTPDFNWKKYLDVTGVPDIEKIIITQPSYTLDFNDILKSTDLNTWKIYLKWKVIDDAASQLNFAMDEQNFKFYGTTLSGTEAQLPMWRRAVGTVNRNLGEVVGKVYVNRHFPIEAKEKMSVLVGNLLKAYEASINDLDWMSDETKVQALDKLSKFTTKIGYPDKWKDYSAIEINKDNLYGNLRSANVAVHNRELAKIGMPIDKSEWHMTPQTVNAYYNPPMNEIVFPAAILQPPFFDMTADDAVNYGAIGAIIGHEIGHGFDDQGSTFNGDGKMQNWWTDTDREEFESRTQALVNQYNDFKVFDDLNVNGAFTLGENIGDLGGLTIALKAYEMSLNGQDAPEMDGFTGTQRVFLGYGQAWLKKSREEALRTQVNTDPHSPAKFRVNGIVRNIPEFYEAFDVKPGDSLYLAPEDRVKIW